MGALESLRSLAIKLLESVMDANGLDIIVSASESMLVVYAALAGWPIATVPLGNLKNNGQPFGLFVLARAGREDLLLQFMSAHHATAQIVKAPFHLFK